MFETPEHPRLRSVEAFPVEVEGKKGFALRDPHRYAPGTIFLTPHAFFIASRFDGDHEVADIQKAFQDQFGGQVPAEVIRQLARELDENFYLDTPRFRALRSQAVRMYHEATRRPAVLAGLSYPTDPSKVTETLDALLASFEGDAEQSLHEGGELRGLLVPHIDLQRGAAGYAHGYRGLHEHRSPIDRVVILGVGHFSETGSPYTLTVKDFETPLGILEADREFIKTLEAKTGSRVYEDEMSFRHEHSIEFPVLLLQHLLGPRPPFRIVPVICGSFHEQIRAGTLPESDPEVDGFLKALRETIAASPGRTFLLGSVDLSHVGPRFGDSEKVDDALLRKIEAADREALAPAAKVDAEGFYRSLAGIGDRYRVCGLSSIYTFLRTIDASRGTLLRYAQSPEPDTGSVVTYTAMAFTR